MLYLSLFFLTFTAGYSFSAEEPRWTEAVSIPLEGRPNPYDLNTVEFIMARERGRLHAQIYPVEITGSLPPYQPVKNLIEDTSKDFLRHWLAYFMQGVSKLKSFTDIEKMLGLSPYPSETDQGVYAVPFPGGRRPEHLMGIGLIHRDGATGFTFSCAACHSSRLFGKTVLGMTNRFPRANEFIMQGKAGISAMPPSFFKFVSNASVAEENLYRQTRSNIQFVTIKKPLARGLDTSLAQVALSLNLRAPTPWAEKSWRIPEKDWLDENPADSKPAVWWNVKYKNRFLSDGAVISGNPIFTNILWNEIGRGVDLHDLAAWLGKNGEVIKELTTAVFSSEAPKYTDFFPAENINLAAAVEGQKIFQRTCAGCHGRYEKNWERLPESAPLAEKLQTSRVLYHEKTPVIDVGTDPLRRLGMRSLEKLSRLQISRDQNIKILEQPGYVPPPLVGIWARWPYFHNNSAPSLCAVLAPSQDRPTTYRARAALDPATDFDDECNGYPLDDSDDGPQNLLYDTANPGQSNLGHDEGIFIKNGRNILSATDRKNLIQFLKTL